MAGRRWPGYLLCGIVYVIAVCILLIFMGDIRERELDMQPPPPSSSMPRPPILLEVTPASQGPLPGDVPEYEVDHTKLHVEDPGLGFSDGHQEVGGGGGVGVSNGMVVGYLGEDKVRAVDTGDYHWAKIFTGVDAYSGRLLLCRSPYDAGGGDEYSEVIHQRKRGYSEPALPVLQEYPSAENFSLSRTDNSGLSLGLKDFDAMSTATTHGDGGDSSIVNASYNGEEDDITGDMAHALSQKISDNSLFKERVAKASSTLLTSGAGASGATRRLSLEKDPHVDPLMYSFASHASGTNEEELKLLEHEAPKPCYGTSGAFSAQPIPVDKQCSLEGAIGGGSAVPESLVETTV